MLIESDEMLFDSPLPGFMIFVHTKQKISDATYDQLLKAVGRLDTNTALRSVAITDGGGPSGPQRKGMLEPFSGKQIKTAVLSDSTIVPFIVSTLALINSGIMSFKPVAIEDALSYLDCSSRERNVVRNCLREMGRKHDRFKTLGTVLKGLA